MVSNLKKNTQSNLRLNSKKRYAIVILVAITAINIIYSIPDKNPLPPTSSTNN
jgi:hypothetical protein